MINQDALAALLAESIRLIKRLETDNLQWRLPSPPPVSDVKAPDSSRHSTAD